MGGESTVTINQIALTALQRTCPLTCGRPTVFYGKESFERACAAKREDAKVYWLEGRKHQRNKPEGLCGVCMAKKVPEEIEIRPKGEVRMVVSAASKKERCDLCESKSAVRTVKDLRVCPTCQNLMAHVNNRLDLLISVIKQRHPERIAELVGEMASVTVESEALKQVAAEVGYTGTDGDGLIAAVEQASKTAASGFMVQKSVSADVVRALDCGEAEWELAAIQSAAYMGKYRRELKSSELLLDHIADVVSYPGKEAGTLPAFIEGICHEFESALVDLAKIKEATGFDVEDEPASVIEAVSLLSQTLDQYRTRCEELAAKSREHEQLAGYREQILMACRDALGMPRIIEEKLLELELWSSKQNVSPGNDVLTPVITALDSHLLDLALECMRGEIIGLHPDQIALLREAV